jgi:hypothetical protein
MKSLLAFHLPIELCALVVALFIAYCFAIWLIAGFLSFAKLTPDAKR